MSPSPPGLASDGSNDFIVGESALFLRVLNGELQRFVTRARAKIGLDRRPAEPLRRFDAVMTVREDEFGPRIEHRDRRSLVELLHVERDPLRIQMGLARGDRLPHEIADTDL